MSESSNRTFSRGRGGGRNRGRTPSSTSMSGSWRAGGDAPAASNAPAASATAQPAAPAPAQASGAAAPNPTRSRANSNRKPPSRAPSFSAAPPPPITVTTPAPSQAAAPATAVPATPKSNKKGGRSRKASAASSTLAPIASSSTMLAPIASAPPNATGFGSKASIDSLVQHIRANAIDHSGKGDWAQDNDDSLPDLDDWDIDTKSNVSGTSNVLVVKDTVQSIKTAPVAGHGLAAQQKHAKDKLAEAKKSRRGGKGKNKDKSAASDASPISPQQPSPATPSQAPAPVPPAFASTAAPSHPLAATATPARALPKQVAVQLPVPKAMSKGGPMDKSPSGHAPLLPSPVFATLNPPFSQSSSSLRRPLQQLKGDQKARNARSGAAPASRSEHIPHLASNNAPFRAINDEVLKPSAVTKPASPIEDSGAAKSVVKLPSPTTTAGARPFARDEPAAPNGDAKAAPAINGSQNTSTPGTPKSNGNTGLPGSNHRRTPSSQSQTSAPRSPRKVGSHLDARETFAATHARTHSTTRPKISVSALFQLNRSLAGNLVPSSKASSSQAVA
ncbi:hypothetical protein EXIGLDRAFT_758345 [Exidia glandulosa HHB12029]|uniref:Uncharacterized protein n=1 Tax=Exidia glandulosa HHB12029 TaxID=1314781 RepID=A0A165QTA4_EXIGL|nr:hypothetical protein EXIGLDRAFT_758345 [Exidia glandulosa HHB12029]